MIDMDSPFERIPALQFRDQMVNIFGYRPEDTPIELCGWLDRVFAFEAPVGWAPGHYDSPQNIYGWLLQSYILGRLDLDITSIKSKIRMAGRIPKKPCAMPCRRCLKSQISRAA